jgi:hypothetical protein
MVCTKLAPLQPWSVQHCGSVYSNCWFTLGISRLQVVHTKAPYSSSGRTSELRVMVPEIDISLRNKVVGMGVRVRVGVRVGGVRFNIRACACMYVCMYECMYECACACIYLPILSARMPRIFSMVRRLYNATKNWEGGGLRRGEACQGTGDKGRGTRDKGRGMVPRA